MKGKKYTPQDGEDIGHYFTSLLDSAEDFVIFRISIQHKKSPEVLVRFVSPSISNLMGISEPDNFESWWENSESEEYTSIVEELKKGAKDGQSINREICVYHKQTKKVRWISVRFRPAKSNKGLWCCFNGFIFDITHQKHASMNLVESEKRLRALTENTAAYICEINREGKIIYANKTYKGVNQGFVIGTLLTDWFPAIRRERIRNLVNRCFKSGKRQTTEYTISDPGGKKQFFYAQLSPVIENEAVKSIIYTATDITDRKSVEAALLESETRFRSMVRNIPGMVYRARTDWSTELIFNSQRISGYGINEFKTGKVNWTDIIHPEHISDATEMNMGEDQKEYRILTKSGDVRWVIDRRTAVYDQENSIRAVDGVIFDISERKEAENLLRENEEKLRAFFESDVIGTLYGDIYGNIKNANDKMLSIIGYSRREISEGKVSWIDITPAEFLSVDDKHIEEARETGACTPYEKQYIRKNGERIWVLVGYILYGDKREESVAFVLDISQRKDSEKALSESEEKFRLIAENTNDVIWTMDFQGNFMYVSPSVERLRGYTPAEVKRMSLEESVTADSLKIVQDKMKEAVELVSRKEKASTVVELEQPCKDGSTVWTEAVVSTLTDEDGNGIGFLGVTRDITERMEAEKTIRESEQQYRVLIEESPLSIEIFNPNGTMIQANRGWEKLWGMSRTMVENKFNALTDPMIKNLGLFESIKAAFKGDTGEFTEVKYVSPDNPDKVRWLHTRFFPLKDENEKIVNIVVMNEDITERKMAEFALRESEEKYRALIEGSPYAIVIHQSGKLVYVNEAATTLVGATNPVNLIGKTIKSFVHPAEWEGIQTRIGKLLDGGKDVAPIENRFRRLDGRYVSVELSGAKLQYQGLPAIQVIALDITERKLALQAQKESEEYLRVLTDAIPGAVYQYRIANDGSESFPFISRGVKDLYGLTEQLVRNNPRAMWKRVIKKDVATLKESLEISRRYNTPWINEHRIKAEDQQTRWIRGSAIPRKDPKKGIVWNGILMDITESKKAQKELEETKDLLQKIIQSLDEAVFVIDARSDTIQMCNPAVKNVFGYKEKELLNNHREILHVSMNECKKFIRTAKRAISRDGYYAGEYQMRDKSGTIIETEHLVAPLGDRRPLRQYLSVVRDITERKRNLRELEKSRLQLRNLAAHTEKIRENERMMIAREIHDEFGQILTVLKMDLSLIDRELKSGNGENKEVISEEIISMNNLIDQSTAKVARLITELRPAVLDNLGLISAIEWQAREFEKKSGIRCVFNPKVQDLNLEKEEDTALFRIVQEALTNVSRHAKANKVIIRLDVLPNRLQLTVTDNGTGIEAESFSKSDQYGILGIQERTLLIGGKFGIQSQPGKGTKISIIIPKNVN